jgi:hypothetical protein
MCARHTRFIALVQKFDGRKTITSLQTSEAIYDVPLSKFSSRL